MPAQDRVWRDNRGDLLKNSAAKDLALDGEASPLPRIPPAPAPEAGPHLGYAIQWFFFAGVAIVGYALLLRRRLAD